MKSRSIILSLACSGAALFAVTSLATSQQTEVPVTISKPSVPERAAGGESANQALRTELDRAAAAIVSRAGVAACLETSDDGNNAVEEAYAEGWIIDVTLEEVEAALKAAAATPDQSDDIAAMRLAHRGSYRFFYKPSSNE